MLNRIGRKNQRRSNHGMPPAIRSSEFQLDAASAAIEASTSTTTAIPPPSLSTSRPSKVIGGRRPLQWWPTSTTAALFGGNGGGGSHGLGRFSPTAVGETIIISVLMIAFLQGMVAVSQYRNNPKGQLMVPPGRTYGTQHPQPREHRHSLASSHISGIGKKLTTRLLDRRQQQHVSINPSFFAPRQILNKVNQWLFLLIPWMSRKIVFVLERNAHLFHLGTIMSLITIWDAPRQLWFLLQQTMQRLNQKKQPKQAQCDNGINMVATTSDEIATTTSTTLVSANNTATSSSTFSNSSTSHDPTIIQRQNYYQQLDSKKPRRIVVIGDSLAVGLGSVNVYDENRNNSVPFCRIENVEGMDDESGIDEKDDELDKPVFPHVLAQTLANQWQAPVHWRSAGVDGGDIKSIEEFCFGVIKEQVDKHQEPDLVFLLCGVNDLKYFVANPFQRPRWPRKFQLKLHNFIQRILTVSPNTTVVLPSVTTQMFHKHSPMNMFPLVFVLDYCVGIWDYQKKLVSHHFPTNQVMYLSIKAREVYRWYKRPKQELKKNQSDSSGDHRTEGGYVSRNDDTAHRNEDLSLIAADGIHPNARCYACWARDLGMKIASLLKWHG